MSSLSEASTTLKLRTRILEVERKFKPTPESIQLLRRNFGVPPFQLFWYRGSKKIHDIYFDIFDHHSRDKTHKPGTGILMSHGVYVRLRNWEWQAKLRVDGNFTQSQFVELRGEKAVGDAIAKTLRLADFRSEGEAKVPMTKLWSGTFTCGSINAIEECNDMEGYFGLDKSRVHPLQKVAEFTSVREEWDLDCFRVVIDKADFGWCVGEVELCESVKVVDGDEESVKKKGEQMDEEIRDFLGRYKWAFPRGEVEGKLSAWFRLKAEQV